MKKKKSIIIYAVVAALIVLGFVLSVTIDWPVDTSNDCLYGLFSNGGKQSLIRYDKDLENPEVVYAFPFGVSVFDIDVSHDGGTDYKNQSCRSQVA